MKKTTKLVNAASTMLIAVLLTGCSTLPRAFGAEKVGIAVIYYAPAWGSNDKGEEVVYFLKQITLESRTDEQNRIYFCSVKPDGTERKEIAWL